MFLFLIVKNKEKNIMSRISKNKEIGIRNVPAPLCGRVNWHGALPLSSQETEQMKHDC